MAEENIKEWVDWINVKILQKAVVQDEEGNILSLRRSANSPASRPDKWDLPGGSVGFEDLIQKDPLIGAIKREIKQETGLEAEDVKSIYTSSWSFERSVGKVLGVAIGYRCRVKGIKPEIALSNEHYESKWTTITEIHSLDFGEDGRLHRNIIERIKGG